MNASLGGKLPLLLRSEAPHCLRIIKLYVKFNRWARWRPREWRGWRGRRRRRGSRVRRGGDAATSKEAPRTVFFSFTTKEEMCSCVSHIKEAHLLHIQEAHLLHRHLCKLKKKTPAGKTPPKGKPSKKKGKRGGWSFLLVGPHTRRCICLLTTKRRCICLLTSYKEMYMSPDHYKEMYMSPDLIQGDVYVSWPS